MALSLFTFSSNSASCNGGSSARGGCNTSKSSSFRLIVRALILSDCHFLFQHHCSDFGAAQVLECLKKVKDDAEFDGKCRKVITAKEILHSKGRFFHKKMILAR